MKIPPFGRRIDTTSSTATTSDRTNATSYQATTETDSRCYFGSASPDGLSVKPKVPLLAHPIAANNSNFGRKASTVMIKKGRSKDSRSRQRDALNQENHQQCFSDKEEAARHASVDQFTHPLDLPLETTTSDSEGAKIALNDKQMDDLQFWRAQSRSISRDPATDMADFTSFSVSKEHTDFKTKSVILDVKQFHNDKEKDEHGRSSRGRHREHKKDLFSGHSCSRTSTTAPATEVSLNDSRKSEKSELPHSQELHQKRLLQELTDEGHKPLPQTELLQRCRHHSRERMPSRDKLRRMETENNRLKAANKSLFLELNKFKQCQNKYGFSDNDDVEPRLHFRLDFLESQARDNGILTNAVVAHQAATILKLKKVLKLYKARTHRYERDLSESEKQREELEERLLIMGQSHLELEMKRIEVSGLRRKLTLYRSISQVELIRKEGLSTIERLELANKDLDTKVQDLQLECDLKDKTIRKLEGEIMLKDASLFTTRRDLSEKIKKIVKLEMEIDTLEDSIIGNQEQQHCFKNHQPCNDNTVEASYQKTEDVLKNGISNTPNTSFSAHHHISELNFFKDELERKIGEVVSLEVQMESAQEEFEEKLAKLEEDLKRKSELLEQLWLPGMDQIEHDKKRNELEERLRYLEHENRSLQRRAVFAFAGGATTIPSVANTSLEVATRDFALSTPTDPYVSAG